MSYNFSVCYFILLTICQCLSVFLFNGSVWLMDAGSVDRQTLISCSLRPQKSNRHPKTQTKDLLIIRSLQCTQDKIDDSYVSVV